LAVPSLHSSEAIVTKGERVVTKVDAPLQVPGKTVTRVPAGTELIAEVVQGDWTWVTVASDAEASKGWIHSKYLQTGTADERSKARPSAVTVAAEGWKGGTFEAELFSIRYPASWRVWSEEEIQAAARGGRGPRPVFAVQSPSQESFYVIVDAVEALPTGANQEQLADGLQKAYVSCGGTDPARLGWKNLSKEVTSMAGCPAIVQKWQMPEMQGVVLVNKHWCVVAGKTALFIAATATADGFDDVDKLFFTPMAKSLKLRSETDEVRKTVTAPGRIAFRSVRDGDWEIYAMNLDGSNLQRLTTNAAQDDMPRWSPDGKQIVFRSERDGNQEIYVMDGQGADVRRLTNNSFKDSEPSFSPDGTRILFSSNRAGQWDLYTMQTDGSRQTRLVTQGGGGRFSPDGQKMVFSSIRDGDPEIYIADSDGSHATRLTNSPGYDGGVAFSGDGSKIAFMSARSGNLDVFVMNADGSDPENVTQHPANDGGPVFAGNDQLVFFSDRDGDIEVYRMSLDTKEVARLTRSPDYDGIADVWIPRQPRNGRSAGIRE